MAVDYACTQVQALEALGAQTYDALVIDPVLQEPCDGLAVADMATVRNPDIVILAVTKSTFLSEGSIFSLIPNARGVMHTPMRPDDLLAYLQHFHARSSATGQGRQAARSSKA